jgi:hypothetical protein
VCVCLSFCASCLIRYGLISLMFLDLCIEFLLLNVCMCRWPGYSLTRFKSWRNPLGCSFPWRWDLCQVRWSK